MIEETYGFQRPSYTLLCAYTVSILTSERTFAIRAERARPAQLRKSPERPDQAQPVPDFAIEVQAAQFSRSGPKWCAIFKPRCKFCDKKRGRRNKDALFDHPKFFFSFFFIVSKII